MPFSTNRNPSWMEWIDLDQFDDHDLCRIITFFVFHSPCSQLTSMSRTLEEYGWSSPWRKPYWLNRQLKQASSNYELLFSASTYDEMERALDNADLINSFPSDLTRERICIYDNQKNQFMSVFYHLRNAFAHCRLKMVNLDGECVFILEDVQPKKGQENLLVSARMILRKSTLLNWIDLIENGEQECEQNKLMEKEEA